METATATFANAPASAEKDLLLGDLFITLQRQLGIECQGFAQAKHGLDEVLHV